MNKKKLSVKYVCILGLLTAILVTISSVTSLFGNGVIVVQFSTGIYIVFCYFTQGIGMLFVGVIYGASIDLIAKYPITIPMTITINIIVFCIMKYGTKILSKHLLAVISASLVLLYLPYQWFVGWNGIPIDTKRSQLFEETIVDLIQLVVSVIIFEIIYFALIKTKLDIKLSKIY